MKRALAVFTAGVLLLLGGAVFAQTPETQTPASQSQGYPTDAYVKNIPLIKVLIHPLGYELLYWRSDMTIGALYVPLAWFKGGTTAKASITYGIGPARPYVSIGWVDGKFDHIIIDANADMQGPTWGVLNPAKDLSAEFNIQEPPRTF